MLRVFLLVVVFPCQAFACLWDRDTLAEEAKGRPELPRIITGWFDRYPPGYYQMRLDRVTMELKSTPADLDLIDDAAVACDRLGGPDEAIGWMAKKKAVLDALPENEARDHRYRYLSNLGTFYLDRWISLPQAEREADLTDLRESEKLIARAIAENPDAHFGREVYQLTAIRWLLWDGVSPITVNNDSGLEFDPTHWVRPFPVRSGNESIDGISGLIQLGLAWESGDAFRSLAVVLESNEMSAIAEIAHQRENELISLGKGSLHPVASVRARIAPDHAFDLTDRKPVDDWFPIARAAANRRNAKWVAYQEARFVRGQHPDTHPQFWKDWVEPSFPKLPGHTFLPGLRQILDIYPWLGFIVVLVGFGALVAIAVFVLRFLGRALMRAVDGPA